MSTFIADIRPVLEALYFLAGILLVIGVALTYAQVVLLKRDIRVRNERASKEKAMEACERYFEQYVPLANKYREDRGSIPAYSGPIGDFTEGSLSDEHIENTVNRYRIFTWTSALNRLESISAGLCSGVGDEQTAFSIMGRSYCSTVEQHYDLLAMSRPDSTCPHYEMTVRLYLLWQPRLNKAALSKTKDDLEKDLAAIKDRSIPPLGQG